ncbi:hypothetical protein [Fulvivirga imtechensis]|uniref:hypothetical protein n=1 Tax=Fulvivirga imtechensis TaxID=881893 RepID=UPI0009FDD4B2|nr:hypothetical protein [Fulvivirga imtechensis]
MKHFKSFIKDLWNYVKIWRELSSIAVGIILWMKSHILLRWIDPTSATYDAGIFQIILFAVIALFVLHGVIRILMKLIWPTTDAYLDNQFANDFKTLESWQKLKLTTSIFFAFLFAAVLLARVL